MEEKQLNKIKTFPLTVSESWLERVDKARVKDESKHLFILRAVENELKRREGIGGNFDATV